MVGSIQMFLKGGAPLHRFVLFAALPFLASCATQDRHTPTELASGGTNECFFASQVGGFKDGGPDRALLRIGFRAGYELTLSPGCPRVDYATNIGIVSRGGSRICEGRPAELVVPRASGSGAQRCLVSNIRRLSDAEMATAWGREPAE